MTGRNMHSSTRRLRQFIRSEIDRLCEGSSWRTVSRPTNYSGVTYAAVRASDSKEDWVVIGDVEGREWNIEVYGATRDDAERIGREVAPGLTVTDVEPTDVNESLARRIAEASEMSDAGTQNAKIIYVPRGGWDEAKRSTAPIVKQTKTTVTVRHGEQTMTFVKSTGRPQGVQRGSAGWYNGWMLDLNEHRSRTLTLTEDAPNDSQQKLYDFIVKHVKFRGKASWGEILGWFKERLHSRVNAALDSLEKDGALSYDGKHYRVIVKESRRLAESAMHDEKMVSREADYPDMFKDFAAANDKLTLDRAKRAWLKKYDNDELDVRAYDLITWLHDRRKRQLIDELGAGAFQRGPTKGDHSSDDARADRILRVTDSSGRSRARKR